MPFFSCNSVFLSWVIGVVLFSLGANIMWGNFSNTDSRLGNFNFSQMSPKADALNPESNNALLMDLFSSRKLVSSS